MTVLEDFDVADGVYDGDATWEGMIRNPLTSLTAAAIPVKPPSAWFTNPAFAQLEPLTVTADGQISGHIASWREDHIGMNGRVKAPRSKSGYAFFATGALETQEGTLVNVGQITLTGGHAPLEASVAEAVAHYDNTNSAFADVAVGEDKHGIWVAGALRPTVDDNALRSIRASSVSGDWRPINGSLEMVAVCAVNVPGFPIPRARVASGVPVALVAAGTGELVDLMLHQDNGALAVVTASFDDRLRFVENVVLGRIGDSREVLTAAVEAARGAYTDDEVASRVAALRASVHPERAVTAAALRERVHPEKVLASALRERVHGGGDAVPFGEGAPLTAATPFAEDLHPRGRDGQFIEKLGIVELFDVKGAKPGQRGKVTQIKPSKQRGRPDILVELQNDDGSIGKTVKVKPDNIESAPEKARLPGQGGPGGPALREAGNVYVGDKIMLPGDLEGTVTKTEPYGDRDGMRIETDMGNLDLRMSDTVTVVPGEAGVAPPGPAAPGPAPGAVNLPDGTPLEPGSQVEINGEVFTVNALEPDPANPGGGLVELDDGSGMPSASKGWYNVDLLSQPRSSGVAGQVQKFDTDEEAEAALAERIGRGVPPDRLLLMRDPNDGKPVLIDESPTPQPEQPELFGQIPRRKKGGMLPTPASGALTADALRARVHTLWDDGMPIAADIRECLQASLRARVNGPLVGRATTAWTAKERDKAASSGAAMPGGRFPIKDCTDVGKAVRALGRGKGDKGAIKKHILKRAKSLGCMSNVPDDWK